jgi:hypothetical protein
MVGPLPFEIVMGVGAVALGVIGYFLRKTDGRIDETAQSVKGLADKFDNRIDKLEEKMDESIKSSKEEIVGIFQEICHERQDACGKLRDAKLIAVENQCQAACNKVRALTLDRDRKWEKQDELNERIRVHIYSSSEPNNKKGQ